MLNCSHVEATVASKLSYSSITSRKKNKLLKACMLITKLQCSYCIYSCIHFLIDFHLFCVLSEWILFILMQLIKNTTVVMPLSICWEQMTCHTLLIDLKVFYFFLGYRDTILCTRCILYILSNLGLISTVGLWLKKSKSRKNIFMLIVENSSVLSLAWCLNLCISHGLSCS